jgi:N-acetylglutamate synthase-like GNAT family acetyltransferase
MAALSQRSGKLMTMDDPLGQRSVRRASWNDAYNIATLLARTSSVAVNRDESGAMEMEVHRLMSSGEFLVLDHRNGGLAATVYVEVDAHRGRLSLLAVDPAVAWTDLGERLVTVAERFCQARGCDFVELAIAQSPAELPPLCRSLGYRDRAGTGAAANSDTIVMSKALAS